MKTNNCIFSEKAIRRFKNKNKLFYSLKSSVPEIRNATKWFKTNIFNNSKQSKRLHEVDQWLWYFYNKYKLFKNFKFIKSFESLEEAKKHPFFRIIWNSLCQKLHVNSSFHSICFFFWSMFNNKNKIFELSDIEEIYFSDNPDVIIKLKDRSIIYLELCLTDINKKCHSVKWNIKKHIGCERIRRTLRHKCKGKLLAKNKIYILWLQTMYYPSTIKTNMNSNLNQFEFSNNAVAYSLKRHPSFNEIKTYIDLEAMPKWKENTEKIKCWHFYWKFI